MNRIFVTTFLKDFKKQKEEPKKTVRVKKVETQLSKDAELLRNELQRKLSLAGCAREVKKRDEAKQQPEKEEKRKNFQKSNREIDRLSEANRKIFKE